MDDLCHAILSGDIWIIKRKIWPHAPTTLSLNPTAKNHPDADPRAINNSQRSNHHPTIRFESRYNPTVRMFSKAYLAF